MAFTRDDTNKMKLNVDRANDSLSYMLNVPGTGNTPNYIVDPQIRLQGFGGNISVNVVDINSMLLGVNKQLDRDCSVENSRDPNFNDTYKQYVYPEMTSAITDQPRAMHPVWQVRDLEQNDWAYLHENPQANTEILFDNNINSRMVEKDIYAAKCHR
jgi:hypothetical protein